MSTVVQTSYKPQILPAVVGMIADMSTAEVITRICETSAGIGFGLAASQGAGDKGCILSVNTGFLGITVRDVTLDRIPLDPLAAPQSLINADVYAQYQNVALMTSGTIWVNCYGGSSTAGVKAGDALFYDTNGHFTNVSGGSYSFGQVTYTAQPTVGDTLTINGDVWTWVAALTSGLQLLVGPTLGDSLRMAAATLTASSSTLTTVQQYRYYPPSPAGAAQGSGANVLQYANETVGTGVFVTSTTTAGATVTAMTPGVAAATAVVGGFWKSSAIAGQIAKVSLGIQR